MAIFSSAEKEEKKAEKAERRAEVEEEPNRRSSIFAKRLSLSAGGSTAAKGSALSEARRQLQVALDAEKIAQTALDNARREAKAARAKVELLAKEAAVELKLAKAKDKEAGRLAKHADSLKS